MLAQGFLCSPVQPHPVIPSCGIEFWGNGAITNQIPLLWHGAFVSEGEGQKQLHASEKLGFFLCLDVYKNCLNSV